MPNYVPNYKHDIFISYAHVDNELLPGAEKGWVTTLVNTLKKLLNQKLGRADSYSLWMDYKLRGNEAVTPDIDEQLKQSATFVFILSSGYLASRWCRLEFYTFFQQAGEDSGRLFMVEYEPTARSEGQLPEILKLLGYPFWQRDEDTDEPRTLGIPKPHPDRDQEYYQQINKLATELANKLKQLQAQAPVVSETVIDEFAEQLRIIEEKNARLENEKATLKQEIDGVMTQYRAVADSLNLPYLPQANIQLLNNQLAQLEARANQLKNSMAKVDANLKQTQIELRKITIEKEIQQLTQQYESTSASLQLSDLSADTEAVLKEQLQQLEIQRHNLTTELAKLNNEVVEAQNQPPQRRVAGLKKSRLQAEQENIKQKMNSLIQQHEFISTSLLDIRLSEPNKQSLNEQLCQIEDTIETLETRIEQINNELKLLK